MRALLLFARRYLLSHKSHSVVNIIAGVSLVSLLLPVAAVIVLLSIFNGFSQLASQMDSAVEGDLTIHLREGKFFEMRDIDTEAIEQIEGVESVSFMSEQMLLIEHNSLGTVLTLRGVDDSYASTIPIEEYIDVGKFEVKLGDLERIVIGNATAAKLKIRSLSDSMIEIYALKTSPLQSLIPMGGYNAERAKLSGVFMLDMVSEESYAYASQRLVNRMLGVEGSASKVAIKSTDQTQIERVKNKVEAIVGESYKVESRRELNPAMYQIIRYEKLGVMLICSLVIILASFSLLGALTMLVIEKRDEVKTLRVMGATHTDIERIFMMEGALISSTAIVLGLILGVGVTLVQQYVGIVELPSSSMMLQYYPVDLKLTDVVGVVVVSLTISLTLSYLTVKGVYKKEL